MRDDRRVEDPIRRGVPRTGRPLRGRAAPTRPRGGDRTHERPMSGMLGVLPGPPTAVPVRPEEDPT